MSDYNWKAPWHIERPTKAERVVVNANGGLVATCEIEEEAILIVAAPALVEALDEASQYLRIWGVSSLIDRVKARDEAMEAALRVLDDALGLLDTKCEECYGTELSPNGDEPCPYCSNPRKP